MYMKLTYEIHTKICNNILCIQSCYGIKDCLPVIIIINTSECTRFCDIFKGQITTKKVLWNMGLGRTDCKTAETEAVKKTEVLMRISAYVVFIIWSDRNSSGWPWVDPTHFWFISIYELKSREVKMPSLIVKH